MPSAIAKDSIQVGPFTWYYRHVQPNASSNKPPVILLHGLPAQSHTWRSILPALGEAGFRALAPDWLGFGFSDKPDKREFAYTPAAYQQALADLLAAWQIERCSLVVQGFLGSVGLQYAFACADRIERLVVLNAPLHRDAVLPWTLRQWSIPFVGDMLTQDPLLMDRTLEGGSGFVVPDEDLDIYRRPFLQTSATGRSLVAARQNLQLEEATAAMDAGWTTWRQPTLLIWGERDPWLEVEPAEKLAATYSNVELVRLPEARHYPQEHWGQEIAPLLVQFLRRSVA